MVTNRGVRPLYRTTGNNGRLRVTAALLALVMLFYIAPPELMALADTVDEPRKIAVYDDESVSHTAGIGTDDEQDVRIVGEQTGKRSETAKQYLLSDGSVMVQEYGFPVHYNDGDGFREIDNRLIKTNETKKTAAYYRNASGYFDVRIAGKIDGKSDHLTVTKDGYSISLGLQSDAGTVTESTAKIEQGGIDRATAKKAREEDGVSSDPVQPAASEKLQASLVFDSVFENTDFEYKVTPTGIKENIIVRQRQERYEYTFSLLAPGLTAGKSGNGILLTDTDGRTVFRMPAMFMTDGAGAYSEAVRYTLTGQAGEYALTVTADSGWINADERVFPVVIDPVIDTWTSGTASGWTLHHDGTRSAPVEGRVRVGKSSYAAIRFPAVAERGDMTLTYGKISLHAKSEGGQISALDYNIYAASAGPAFENVTSIDDLTVDPAYIWRATAGSIDRKKWIDFKFSGHSVVNDELILLFKNTNSEDIQAAISVNATDYLPVLTLYYQTIQGVSDYPSEPFDLGNATAYVNMVSRKLAVTVGGLSVNTDYLPLQADLIYNQGYNATLSELGVANYFGNHIKTSYNQYVRVSNDFNVYYHIGADGSVNTYLRDPGNHEFYLSEKTNKSLHVKGVGVRMFDDIGNEMMFEYGRLKYIRPENPLLGEIRVVYAQSGGQDTDRIDSIQYYRYGAVISSNEIQYVYAASGLLTELVTYYRDADNVLQPIGRQSFSYSAGNLVGVNNSAGASRLTLGYTGDRLTALKNSAGAGYAFAYDNDRIGCVTQTQGTAATRTYDSVTFSTANNTVSAQYTGGGISAGSRHTATDNQKRVVSDWYTDAAGNSTVRTDSLWRNSGNDPIWPNYTRSVYGYEQRTNTNFPQSFMLIPFDSRSSLLRTAPAGKPGNKYALSFRLYSPNNAADLTVAVGGQIKRVRTSGAADTFVTLPLPHTGAGTQIRFTNNTGLPVHIMSVGFCAVTQVNQYKSLTGVMYAYRIYKQETIDTERTAVTTYRQNTGIEKIVETDNATGAEIKTTTYEYADEPAGRVGRLTGITETRAGKQLSKITRTNSDSTATETVQTATTRNNRTYRSTVTYVTGVNQYTRTVKDENDVTTTYAYGLTQGDIRLVSVQRGDEKYTYTYDADGNVTNIRDAGGGSQTLNYTNGTFSGASYGTGNVLGLSFNAYSLPSAITANTGIVMNYTYNSDGDLSAVQYANGQSVGFGYSGRQLNAVTYADSDSSAESIAYTTDSAGRVTDITVTEGETETLRYEYTDLHSRTKRSMHVWNTGSGYSASYAYTLDDEKKRLTGETHTVAGSTYDTAYEYDDKGRIESVSTNGYKTVAIYDDFGRMVETYTYCNNKTITHHWYEYSNFSQLVLKREGRNSGSRMYLNNPGAVYDSQGRIETLRNDNSANRTFRYTYDAAGRLASEKQGNRTTRYTYDSDGNLYTVKSDQGQDYYVYENGKLVLLYNRQDYTFSYDAVGNPVTYKNSALQWTRGRLLKSGTQKGNTFTYKYDADNLRYEKTVNGIKTQYYYNGGQIQAEERGNSLIYYLYGLEGVAGMVYQGQYYVYEKNVLGDVVAIFDGSGKKVASYDYDAWGNILASSGAMADINPFRYRSYYMDDETGFYYLNTRYYDPQIRRFVNADNYALIGELAGSYGQINMYNYCNNNPVMYTDPNGEFAISILIGLGIAAGIGAAVGAVAYTASELLSYGITGQWSWSWGMFTGSILGGAIGGASSFIPVVGSVIAAGITGVTSNAIGMGLENVLDGANHSLKQILFTSTISGVVSMAAAGMLKGIPILGFNAGKGSLQQVTKLINTKFLRGQINRISVKSFEKMLAYNLAYSSLGSFMNGFLDATQNYYALRGCFL